MWHRLDRRGTPFESLRGSSQLEQGERLQVGVQRSQAE